jgi:hypothetical protein
MDECGQGFTLDLVRQQFDPSAFSEALKALHRSFLWQRLVVRSYPGPAVGIAENHSYDLDL